MIPVIIFESVPSFIKFRSNIAREELGIQIPIEISGFLNYFETVYFSPTAEEAITVMDEKGLFTDPHLFYVFSDKEKFIEDQVICLRRHHETALSPLFISMNLYTNIIDVTDGVFKSFSENMISKASEIWEILSKFDPNPYAASLPENKRISYIRFLTSRKLEEEKPVLQKDSIKGFFYPRAYYIFSSKEKGEELDELENLKMHKILESEIVNKTSLCPFCKYYTLIFREVCPSCGSVRIKIVEFIHHYSCGYIGPVDEFIKGDRLVCPKCHEELKHIGVDYDKPLEKYICDDCGARFLEPDIDVLCANCKKKFKPEDVESEFINKYFLTPFGKMVAFEGKLPINIFEEVSVSLGVINYSAFSYILDKFIRISERYPERKFCVIGIYFSIVEEAFAEVPLKIRTFLKDLISIIKDNIRSSDILSASEDKYLFILLPETPKEGGIRVYERIQSRINKLLVKNKLTDFIKFRIALECSPSTDKFSTSQELIKAIIDKLRS